MKTIQVPKSIPIPCPQCDSRLEITEMDTGPLNILKVRYFYICTSFTCMFAEDIEDFKRRLFCR